MLKHKLKAKQSVCHPDKPLYARQMCRQCYEKWLRENNSDYYERQQENARQWRQENRDRKREQDINWRSKRDPQYGRIRTLRKYGLTLDEYDRILREQHGVCAICGGTPKGQLHIDHDHETGDIRGLLCFRCNFGLSFFSENSETLRRASQYLLQDNTSDLVRELKETRYNECEQATARLREVRNNCRTKEISPEIKLEMRRRYNAGAKIKDLCNSFPQFSRSAISRTVKQGG